MHSTPPHTHARKNSRLGLFLSLLGVGLYLIASAQTVFAETNVAAGTCPALTAYDEGETESVVPLTNVQATPNASVSIYSQPTDPNNGMPPLAIYPAGFVWF